jgi:hypothetical protein
MKKAGLKFLAWFLSVFAIAAGARADSIINNFTTSYNYIANGIIGDTNWDGVYLRFGDIPGGNNGGDGNGNTLVANANVANPGFLTVQSTAGTWVGNGDDGFFLYKVVSGDFDAAVQVANPFLAPGFHLPGILARAWNTNNSGAPYSATVTNSVENWMYIARFQEFAISEHVRYATNGTDHDGYLNSPGDNTDLNTPRYVRLTRVGNIFSFYEKTNQTDAWSLMGTLARADLAGVAIQVGIEDGVGSTASPTTFFTDFELSGPNVSLGTPTLPGTPSGIVTTATNVGGSLTFSWTVGTPGDSSLVVVRRNGNIQINPVQGLKYNADTVFGASDALMGSGQSVVFSGTGNSVTVTNLGANNINYTVAVYEYTNTGSAIVYNTASPTTNVFVGPGTITAASLTVPKNDIPVAGAVKVSLIASFSTGETSDQTAASSWTTSDATIASVDAAGTVTGITNGVATITGTFGPFVLNTNITVHTPVFVDGFTSTNNYLANGLVGSMYDGMFLKFGDFPGEFVDATGPGNTIVLDSQVSSTNGLQINSFQTDWQGIRDDGTFLFKIVPGSRNSVSGDFEASMEVNTMNTLAAAKVGLMARLYNPTTAGPAPGGNENHVNYYKVQNGSTQISSANAATATIYVPTGPAPANRFMLLQRVNSTNFYFFEKPTTNAAWTYVTNIVLIAATNDAPMEVGIAEETRSGVTAIATVRSFMLDAAGVASATPPPPAATNLSMTLNGDLSMTLNWVAEDSIGNPVQSIAVMRAGAPVSAQPSLGQPLTASSVFGTTASGLGAGNYVVFVSSASPASINNTVTVSGLAPGVTYYTAIYTFTGSGATKVFNEVSGVSTTLTDGFLTGVVGSLAGGIPVGGIGQLLVKAIYNGIVPVDVSTLANISSANTNIIKVLNGVLTGITNGTTQITNSFGGFTNVANVTVRNPFFSDNFTNAQDYLANGVTNTGWDDLYNPRDGVNPIPGSTYVPLTGSGTTVADANISSNNVLTITSAGDGWENAAAGGFFLFKYVPGDFQAAVHINSFDVANYNQPGIMARGYSVTNGLVGAPLGYAQTNAGGTNTAGEYWVDLTRFDEFGIGTYARDNIDSVVSQNTQTDQGDTNYWLLVSRTQGTNFVFYKRLNPTDPWKRLPNNTSYSLPQFAGRPMQVGLASGPFTGGGGTTRTVRFENFLLDITGGSPLTVSRSGANVIVSWPPIPGTLQQSTSLTSQNWQPVPGTPVLDTNGYSLTIPASGGTDFFRLKQ